MAQCRSVGGNGGVFVSKSVVVWDDVWNGNFFFRSMVCSSLDMIFVTVGGCDSGTDDESGSRRTFSPVTRLQWDAPTRQRSPNSQNPYIWNLGQWSMCGISSGLVRTSSGKSCENRHLVASKGHVSPRTMARHAFVSFSGMVSRGRFLVCPRRGCCCSGGEVSTGASDEWRS